MIVQFTGHPFVDSGFAGLAALLEEDGTRTFSSPVELLEHDLRNAVGCMTQLYGQQIAKDGKSDKMPLLYFLLQEVLPGSSWDQWPDESLFRFLT